jgi:hypothetical protein
MPKKCNTVCCKARKKFKSGEAFYGYIFPDGKYIGMDGSHADIIKLYKFRKPKGSDYYKSEDIEYAMKDFVKKCNCILVHSENTEEGINLNVTAIKKPTSEQIATIGKTLPSVTSVLALRKRDLYASDICSFEMDYPHPVHLQRWVSKCW